MSSPSNHSSPHSSPQSSHATTIYSQGPPSHNTRSSTMNRTMPNTTPPASYRTALLHIQQRENANASIRSELNNAPSELSNLSPPTLARSSPILPSRTTLSPSLHSNASSSSASIKSVPINETRHRIMQEYMDTIHDDVASLGHKHDHAMNEMDNLREDIAGIDLNITSINHLIVGLSNKLDGITVPPSAVPNQTPSNVPRTAPTPHRPVPIQHRSTLIPSQVPSSNVQSMSQTSSFTSIPHHSSFHSHVPSRAKFPAATLSNSVRDVPVDQLDSDLSLASEPEHRRSVPSSHHSHVIGPDHNPDTRAPVVMQPSFIHGSRNFPTTQPSLTPSVVPRRLSQNNTPVINNSGIVHPQPTEPASQFNSNLFLLILDDIPKIKYSSIESSLAKRLLDDDSNQAMQKFYESIIRSLNIGFSTTLHFLPMFEQFDSNLSFQSYFLSGLIGSNYDKASNIYHQLGQIIKDRITNHECVSPITCAKAHLIINSYRRLDGWQLLETLFKGRLVNCGALSDTDLDTLRVTLMLRPQESIHSFFHRTQAIENEYIMQMSRHPHLIPHFKLVRRFVSELMRAREYHSYVIDYHKSIIRHVKRYGEHTNTQINFTLHQVYEDLTSFAVIAVPTSLDPSPNDINSQKSSLDMLAPLVPSSLPNHQGQGQPILASAEIDTYDWYSDVDIDITQPVIAAALRNVKPRKFCQACMTIGHDADRCFLRGIKFRPKELSQRLNVYNQQNGDAPPPGTVLPTWNPRSPPPMIKQNNGNGKSNRNNSDHKPNRPFSNAVTKSSGKPSKDTSINSLITDEPTDAEDDTSPYPSLSTFIASQQQYDANTIFESDDDHDIGITPIIAMMSSSHLDTLSPKPFDFESTEYTTKCASDYTPSNLVVKITTVHQQRSNSPSPRFFCHFSQNLHSLHHNQFRDYCKLSLQVDSGANVNAVTDKRVLAFFVPNSTTVETVNGESFLSEGWGGILIRLKQDQPPFLCCPVYVCPRNPRNTLSIGAFKTYSSFQRATADAHVGVDLITHNNIRCHLPARTYNGLDFVDLQICSFAISPYATTASLRPSISNLDTDTINSDIFIFPRDVMYRIATFYVHLHDSISPRHLAIQLMNVLLHSKYNPPIISESTPSISLLHPHLQTSIMPLTSLSTASSENVIVPVMGKLYRSVLIKKQQPIQSYMVLHLLLQHTSQSTIMKMIKKKTLADIPDLSALKDFTCTCSICNIAKATRIPRGKIVDTTQLLPFQRLHVDFSFFGIESIRGYTTALDIVCASTSYPFGFPTKSKSPPLGIFRWFVQTIRTMGHHVLFIRVDEDKGLAESSEFCKLVMDLNCVLETTGGGNSENNGKVERQNRSKANMVRSALATGQIIFGTDLPSDMKIESLWCFAYQHACYTHRVLYNRMRDNSSFFLVHQDHPTAKRLAIWGSITTALSHNKNSLPKLSNERAKKVYFMTFGNNTSNIIYWDPNKPRKWFRCHHAIIDQVSTFQKLRHIFSTDSTLDKDNSVPELSAIHLPLEDGPFPSEDITTVTFQIPAVPTPIGLSLLDDTLFNLPFITTCQKGSSSWLNIPPKLRRQSFILNINGDGPITALYALTLIKDVQKSTSRMLTLDLVKRRHDPSTPLSMTRAMFDQLPSLLKSRPVISHVSTDVHAAHDHFITSPTKPIKPKSFFQCLKGPFRQNWIAAAKISFEKNRKVGVFSVPFPRRDLPPDTNVFRTLLVPDFKPTDIPNVYKCKVRDCTVGTKQVKGIDFPESYCAVVDATTFRLTICLAASLGYTIAIIDVENAFQTSIAPEEYRIFVTVPVLYMQWLRETEDLVFDKETDYVRQMFNANQGTKAASHIWYWLLVPILAKYGFHRSTVDHALLIKAYDDGTYFYICLATDDLLCAFRTFLYFDDLVKYLRRYFNLTVQSGHVITFLSLRIIQSDHAITVDQGEYIFDLVHKYYGSDIDRIKTVSTPMRSDSAFERELFESTPLTGVELQDYSLQYKGSYRHHTGKFQFAVTWTRFDLGFALQRLAEYNNQPTSVTFESIGRVYRYLAGDIIRPLTYPRNSLRGTTTISYFVSPDKKINMSLPNDLQLFTDSEFARSLSDRRSYYCIIFTLLNVAIQCKCKKSDNVAGHTTDAEMKGTYAGVRRLLPLRRLLESMGFPCQDPTPLYVDNAAVSAIIDAKRMTPRCRHLDIPIAYLHEQHDKSYHNNLISTVKMLADLGTKPLVVALHRRFKYWACGHMFLPPKGSDHYDYLQLQFYEACFVDVLKFYQR